MTPEETRRILGKIAVIDNRKATPETARTWHELLNGFTYAQAANAVKTIRLNTPDLWITPGHIAQVIRNDLREQGWRRTPSCEHGIPLGNRCHDCTHDPDTCAMCQPQPGISDTPANIRATITAFRNHTRP